MSHIRSELVPLAARLGCEAAALQAVVSVESGGQGGLVTGRALIRLEVHHLWREATSKVAIDARFRVLGFDISFDPIDESKIPIKPPGVKPQAWLGHLWRDAGGRWLRLHMVGKTGQAREWNAYQCARDLDAQATILSTSYGLLQVLGEHWRDCGYPSPSAFELAQGTEAGQLEAFARLLAAPSKASWLQAILDKDWTRFAADYNGRLNITDYSSKLAAAYAKASS